MIIVEMTIDPLYVNQLERANICRMCYHARKNKTEICWRTYAFCKKY